jgi:hypothetical protein
MRRVVRSLKTQEYFSQGHWTREASQAQDFADAGNAIAACLRYHLTDVELVLQLSTEPQEFYDTHLRLFDYGSQPDEAVATPAESAALQD